MPVDIIQSRHSVAALIICSINYHMLSAPLILHISLLLDICNNVAKIVLPGIATASPWSHKFISMRNTQLLTVLFLPSFVF